MRTLEKRLLTVSFFVNTVWYACSDGKCWRGTGSNSGAASLEADLQTRWRGGAWTFFLSSEIVLNVLSPETDV